MKQLFLFMLLALSAFRGFCQFHALGLPASPAGSTAHAQVNKTGAPYQHPGILSTVAFDSVRALGELNVPSMADAYPWLSADALRLYYTKQTGVSINEVYFTQRATTSSYFNAPVLIPLGITDVNSIWLTRDELDMYVFSGVANVWHTHRSSTSAAFPLPAPITITYSQLDPGIFFGISLTSNQNSLFLGHFTPANKRKLLEFTRTSATEFTETRLLTAPAGYRVNTAQISKDDLTLYFALDSISIGNNIKTYYSNRATLADTFELTSLQPLQGVNQNGAVTFMPSMSDSLHWLAFARNNLTNWPGNDLYIAHSNGTVTSVFNPELKPSTLSVFPNPSTGTFRLSSTRPGKVEAAVYSITGERVFHAPALELSNTTSLDLSAQPKGFYLLQLRDGKQAETRKLVIE